MKNFCMIEVGIKLFGDLTATGLVCPIRQKGDTRKRELRRDFYMFYYKISISLAISQSYKIILKQNRNPEHFSLPELSNTIHFGDSNFL